MLVWGKTGRILYLQPALRVCRRFVDDERPPHQLFDLYGVVSHTCRPPWTVVALGSPHQVLKRGVLIGCSSALTVAQQWEKFIPKLGRADDGGGVWKSSLSREMEIA